MQISLRVTPEVYEAIKAVAAAEKRSVNRQLELMIEDWLRRRGGPRPPGRSGSCPGSPRTARATTPAGPRSRVRSPPLRRRLAPPVAHQDGPGRGFWIPLPLWVGPAGCHACGPLRAAWRA